jgi:hypothetical protein
MRFSSLIVMNLQLRAIKTADLEQRVARLEKLLAELGGKKDEDPQ